MEGRVLLVFLILSLLGLVGVVASFVSFLRDNLQSFLSLRQVPRFAF